MADKYTVGQKIQIVIESLSATNIADLCRRRGISVVQLNRWKEKFIDGGSRALGESLRRNPYQKEIDDLKRLLGDQALVMDALKKVDRRRNKDDC